MGGLRHFLQSDNAPAVPLALVTILLGLYVFSQNANFLSAFNINNILSLATALGFIALGQTIALLLGAIDLSVGPLSGFLVVVASFFINDDKSAFMITAGFVLVFLGAVVVGGINGLLIRFANFTPIAATLAMYIGLQGMSFLLRENPGGYINSNVVETVTSQFGPIPVAFIALVAVAVASEYLLRKTGLGWRLRATGSNEESARRVGVRVDRTYLLGLHCVLASDGDWRGDADVPNWCRRSATRNKLHALKHNCGRSRRDKPSRADAAHSSALCLVHCC